MFSHARTRKAANSKVFTWKLRDNTTHSKGVIRAWAVEAMRMNSLLPAVLFLTWFIRQASLQAWFTWKISTLDPGITILISQLTRLAWLSCHRKVDFCCVKLRFRDLCKASQPYSCNQALSCIARFYALPWLHRVFKAPEHTHKISALPSTSTSSYPLIHALSIQILSKISEEQS